MDDLLPKTICNVKGRNNETKRTTSTTRARYMILSTYKAHAETRGLVGLDFASLKVVT
jgi:hypothetical protein